MGILILAVLAMGVVSTVRWMISFSAPRFKRSTVSNIVKSSSRIVQSVVVPEAQKEIDFSSFESPAFIRRGLKFPTFIPPVVLGGLDFSDFETPSFLRRGMQYPVLTERKLGRKRKLKPAFAAA